MKIPSFEEQAAEPLRESGICLTCQAIHSVNVRKVHLSFYCQHSQLAILMVAGIAQVTEGVSLEDYQDFVTDLQGRVAES